MRGFASSNAAQRNLMACAISRNRKTGNTELPRRHSKSDSACTRRRNAPQEESPRSSLAYSSCGQARGQRKELSAGATSARPTSPGPSGEALNEMKTQSEKKNNKKKRAT